MMNTTSTNTKRLTAPEAVKGFMRALMMGAMLLLTVFAPRVNAATVSGIVSDGSSIQAIGGNENAQNWGSVWLQSSAFDVAFLPDFSGVGVGETFVGGIDLDFYSTLSGHPEINTDAWTFYGVTAPSFSGMLATRANTPYDNSTSYTTANLGQLFNLVRNGTYSAIYGTLGTTENQQMIGASDVNPANAQFKPTWSGTVVPEPSAVLLGLLSALALLKRRR